MKKLFILLVMLNVLTETVDTTVNIKKRRKGACYTLFKEFEV